MSSLTPEARIEFYRTVMHPMVDHGYPTLKRHWHYLHEISTDQKIAQGAAAAGYIGGGALVLGYIGVIAGSAAAHYISPNSEASEKISGIIAGFLGGVSGGCLGFGGYLVHTENTKSFQIWHEKHKDELLNYTLFLKYSEDQLLKNFVCEISQSIMVAPARTPTGHLIDYYMLMQMPLNSEGKITCPFTRETFLPINIKRDFERALLINKRSLHLIEEDIRAASGRDCQMVHLLAKQLNFLREVVEECFQNCLLEIESERIKGLITFQESQKRRDSFVKVFGDTSKKDLDWNIDWKQELDARWSEKNNGTKIY